MDSTTSDNASGDQGPPIESTPGTNRQIDPIDRPARQLGAKRFALQAQRRRQAIWAWRAGLTSGTSAARDRVITSADGTLAFAVIGVSAGLMVERRQWLPAGIRLAETMVFDNATIFDRWCDSEPLRFDDPELHTRLRRAGHEILDGVQ
jgi:hypothetical protein